MLSADDGAIQVWVDRVRYSRVLHAGVAEVDFLSGGGGVSVYDGTAHPFAVDAALHGPRGFDDLMRRYAAVINDASNPVVRVDVMVSTPAAKKFLGAWRRRIARELASQRMPLRYMIKVQR